MTNSTAHLVRVAAIALVVTASVCVASRANAQAVLGARVGVWANPTNVFVGAEALFPMREPWTFDPNAEVVFRSSHTLAALSADFLYRLQRIPSATFWIGAGPAVLVNDLHNGDTRTDLGLNLLVRAELVGGRSYSPYIEGKVVLSDNNRAALGFGLRF
jgi:hypothetical protein